MTEQLDLRVRNAALPLAERTARYEKAKKLRKGDPEHGVAPMTLDAIGQTFDPPLSRAAVSDMLRRGRPNKVGRPPKE